MKIGVRRQQLDFFDPRGFLEGTSWSIRRNSPISNFYNIGNSWKTQNSTNWTPTLKIDIIQQTQPTKRQASRASDQIQNLSQKIMPLANRYCASSCPNKHKLSKKTFIIIKTTDYNGDETIQYLIKTTLKSRERWQEIKVLVSCKQLYTPQASREKKIFVPLNVDNRLRYGALIQSCLGDRYLCKSELWNCSTKITTVS